MDKLDTKKIRRFEELQEVQDLVKRRKSLELEKGKLESEIAWAFDRLHQKQANRDSQVKILVSGGEIQEIQAPGQLSDDIDRLQKTKETYSLAIFELTQKINALRNEHSQKIYREYVLPWLRRFAPELLQASDSLADLRTLLLDSAHAITDLGYSWTTPPFGWPAKPKKPYSEARDRFLEECKKTFGIDPENKRRQNDG